MSINAIIAQGLSLVALVLIFYVVFKKYPLKANIQYIVFASLFVLLSVVLNAISFVVPFFGVPSVKVGLSYLPLVLAGVFLPPSWAYLVGFVMDIVGLIITPTSFPFLGFTLTHVLSALIPSLWFQEKNPWKKKIDERFIYAVLGIISLMATVYILYINKVSISGELFVVSTPIKLSLLAILWALTAFITGSIYLLKKNMKDGLDNEFIGWVLVIVIHEILNSVILTSIWMDTMYGIPWFASMFLRIVKACIMIPIEIVLGYSILKVIRRVMKK